MKNLLGILAAVTLVGATAAFTPAPEDEAATVIRSGFCALFDAEEALWFDFGCRVQSVETKNGYVYHVHGRLPDGAALPDRTLRRKVSDIAILDGCFEIGDRGDMVVTPSGRVNITCHPAR
jgi:hypothetical protein